MNKIYIITLFIGIMCQGLSLSNMIRYNNKTKFKTPFFTIDKNKYKIPFKENKETLDNYKSVLYFDNYLAISYFITYISLYNICIINSKNSFIKLLYKITIPSQSLLDWIENYILNSQIDSFLEDNSIKNQYLFVTISSIKWLCATSTFGLYIIPLFKLYSFTNKFRILKKN